MRPGDFGKWVETARAQNAVRLVVRRARRSSGAEGVFCEELLDGLDVSALLVRMREDVVQRARVPSAVFELEAFIEGEKEKAVMRERITVSRDDDPIECIEVPAETDAASILRMSLAQNERAYRLLAEKVNETNGVLLGVLDKLSDRLVQSEEKHGETLGAIYDMATLQKEREDARHASEERRELIRSGVDTAGPIVAMIAAKVGKDMGPLVAAFFKSLTPEQLDGITALMRPEQIMTLGDLSEIVAKNTTKPKPKDEPKKDEPTNEGEKKS